MFDNENDFAMYSNNILNPKEAQKTPQLYEHPYLKDYFLVNSTLGIGQKINPLFKKGYCGTIANDIVAANLNNIASTGAIPMFFSYYAESNHLREGMDEKFQSALQNKLEEYNCTLLDTQINKFERNEDTPKYSIGGFLVGIVKKEKFLDKINAKEDDIIIGLSSGGIHTCGFDVIEKLRQENKISNELYEKSLDGSYIYSDVIEKLISKNLIYSAINITDGIKNSISRSMPYGLCASINTELIPKQEIFEELEKILSKDVAYATFNMGVGFCVVTSEENCEEVLEIAQKFNPFIFGKIRKTITNEEKISHICIR